MNRNCGRQEVIVIAALCIVVGIGCTEAPEEEPAPSADVEESTPGDDADRALQEMLAIETIKNYPEVLDAAISQDGQDFRLALIVPANTPQARAQELGDNFVRMVKSYADTPPQREIGPGEYDYTIGVYTPDERQIAVGAKVAFAPNITW